MLLALGTMLFAYIVIGTFFRAATGESLPWLLNLSLLFSIQYLAQRHFDRKFGLS